MKFIFGTLGYFQVIFTQVLKRIWPCVPKALMGMSKFIKNADCIPMIRAIFLCFKHSFRVCHTTNTECEFLI